MSDTAKIVVTFFDDVMEQLNQDNSFARNVDVDTVDAATQQNANDIYWKPVEQQRKLIEGWDLTGQEGKVIEQAYPLKLNGPINDFTEYRVDQLRDRRFMDRQTRATAKRMSSDQNKRIADLVANTGSMYYESNSNDFDFVAQADALMTERQIARDMGAHFFLNPRSNLAMAGNLASRTLYPNNRSENAYGTALIGQDVAGFDVLRAPTYGNIAAAAGGTTTVASDVLNIPQGYIDLGNDVIQNVDYRLGTIDLTDASTFAVGDVITFAGVNALGINDKTDTKQLMTFRIVAKSTNTISVYPKPIAADQAGITRDQAAYANISTAITSGTVCSKVNTTGGQANSFWADDSICIVNGDDKLEVLNEFEGMKVVSETLDSGVKLYMAYDANLATVNCRVRVFTRYGLVNKDPSRNGNAIYTP